MWKAAVGLLGRRLQAVRPSPPVKEQAAMLATSERFMSRRQFGLALEAANDTISGPDGRRYINRYILERLIAEGRRG